jgi:transcriptional regulator with XRE-family HTH domain
MKLSQLIKALRQKEGLSQDELGKLIGKNQLYISRLESEANYNSVEPIDKLLTILISNIMKTKLQNLGILIAKLEKIDNKLGMKHLIQENPERFFIHQEDFIRIVNGINEAAIRNDFEPVIFTGAELDLYTYDREEVKMYLFEGYYKS